MSNLKRYLTVILIILIPALMVNLTSCKKCGNFSANYSTPKAGMNDIISDETVETENAEETECPGISDKFVKNASRFSIDLFKRSVTKNKNTLVSPLSVLLALSMTANGAKGETLAEMERVLGNGVGIDELNEYLHTYTKSLPNKEKSKFLISNSVWFRDYTGFKVNESFLQKNAQYFEADVFKEPFNTQTLENINNWVKNKTDGMIEKIIDKIQDDSVMYLVNAIVFDAEWMEMYSETKIQKREFTNLDGSKVTVDMMISDEYRYIDDDNAKGFIKPYVNGDYSFVAILPNEGVSIYDYINSLTGESFIKLVKNARSAGVNAFLPRFSYEYDITMNEVLKSMGMKKAFDLSSADFSEMGFSTTGKLYISEVLHKTFISVDTRGTKAGAATSVGMKNTAIEAKNLIILDRPFVYAIIDNETNLPIFIGAVVDLRK